MNFTSFASAAGASLPASASAVAPTAAQHAEWFAQAEALVKAEVLASGRVKDERDYPRWLSGNKTYARYLVLQKKAVPDGTFAGIKADEDWLRARLAAKPEWTPSPHGHHTVISRDGATVTLATAMLLGYVPTKGNPGYTEPKS